MYLKSVTVKGFKSFPDRTRLEFGPGTSVIVGPNGSGKSNVTDAVLWALGEQSPAAVRGQTMADVIFGGAPGRQAASAAEVELVLDDSEGRLGMGSEVSIYRRLDRGGDGEYRLSGARCRLTDILEVLSDTGLGKEMHSVISQGRVDAIVMSKPADRRLLIEEAAGLGKHRKRRRRATLKLGHTQDNLDRALDVEREARTRLKPLKRQSEAAELHDRIHRQTLEARWELGRDDLLRALTDQAEAVAAATQARTERDRITANLATVAAARRAAEETLAARSARREELSRRSFAAQSAADRVGDRAEAVAGALATLSARVARSEAALAAAMSERAQDQPDLELEARVRALTRELDALERDREAELARQLAELEGQRTDAETVFGAAEADLDAALRVRHEAEAAHEQARGAVRDAERVVDARRRESARIGGELAAVNQFLRSHQAAPGGGRPLADGLAVVAGYELAVAAALDGRLGAAVVDTAAAAAELLARAGRDGGRVLIADPEQRAPASGPRASPQVGAERLADQVSGDGPAAELARILLADAWVLPELTAPPEGFAGLLVTREGRVHAPAAREMRQAPAVGEERVLAERNRREQLLADADGAVQAEQVARTHLAEVLEAANLRSGDRDRAVQAHRAAVHRRDEAAEALRRLSAQIERRRTAPDEGEHAGRRAQLQAELRAEQSRADRNVADRAARAERIGRLQAQIDRDRALVPWVERIAAALGEIIAAITVRRGDFDAALTADRAAGEAAAAELRETASAEVTLQSALNDASNVLTGREVRAERANDHVAQARRTLDDLAAELGLEPSPAQAGLESAAREALNDRISRLLRRREQLGPVNPLAQREYEEALAHVEELETQRYDLEAAMRELEKLIRDTDRQIRETFEVTFAAAAANFAELSARVFPGGNGRLRLVTDRDGRAATLGGQAATGPGVPDPASGEEEAPADPDGEQLGVEIEITPAGKAMKRLSLLSGGEKSMTALAFLFAVFLAQPCPFYILDEVEAALDDLNISRFLDLLDTYSERAQFIVVTHQKRTMEAADVLYGVSMGGDGVSKVISRRLPARSPAAPLAA
ncbi:chromosome segregation SMC family protein [Conexibacter sp. DBS9H8]|uniref:chromosome segregation SMC family protein n=1 Tax=Conexibacter sp. DBS9H8 TaxID=2937801 RepID=UPI00201087AC|nr:AAA family ATPase [Conexibacter sp. DBS9H8]